MEIAEPLTMAYPQKMARDIIIGLSGPIIQHLVKLAGFRLSRPFAPAFQEGSAPLVQRNSGNTAETDYANRLLPFLFDPLSTICLVGRNSEYAGDGRTDRG